MANNIIIKLKRLNRRRESERGENTSDGNINKKNCYYRIEFIEQVASLFQQPSEA